uniref:Uncharacterized protein n=1 Tax=Romanomermis culicivorax TaxID=13658 RepID=A0A915JVB2_ROMCU
MKEKEKEKRKNSANAGRKCFRVMTTCITCQHLQNPRLVRQYQQFLRRILTRYSANAYQREKIRIVKLLSKLNEISIFSHFIENK